MAYHNEIKITFPDLIINQIQIIQKICSKELRDWDKILKNALGEQVIEGDDTRYSFLQSVELLGSMLSPYFGKSEIKFSDYCTYCDTELIELLENKDFKTKLKEIFDIEDVKKIRDNEVLQNQVNIFLLNDKIKEGRKIFRELIKIFKDNSFLGEETYGDNAAKGKEETSSLEAVEEDEEGDVLAWNNLPE